MVGSSTFTITVTDAVLATASGIYTLVVNPGASATMAFAVQPNDTVAGSNISPAVQVKVLNASSAPIQGAVVTIAIANNPASGVLSGTLTAITNASGIASFSTLNINAAAGGYTLTASVGSFSTTSNAFNILSRGGHAITTVAGSTWTPPAGGGLATSYPLGFNQGIAFDSSGNTYVADTNNNAVYKITPGGVISFFAGTGVAGFSGDNAAASAAQLNSPAGIAIDSSNNVYISDRNNNRIRKVDAGGTITTFAGNGTATFAGDGLAPTSASLSAPNGIALDSGGNLHIADTNNHRIRKISGGLINTVAGNGTGTFGGDGLPATSASIRSPQGVAFDASGNLYIADTANHRIRMVSWHHHLYRRRQRPLSKLL